MATYREIQEFVKEKFGYKPKTCWIAHAKEVYGLPLKVSPNRKNLKERLYPCPEQKLEDMKEAFRHFGML